MGEPRVPQWHPIAALPMIGQAIDGMLDSAEEVVQSLEQARPRPHVLDDATIGRVREAHGTQLNDLWWYTEQLARWQRASPTRGFCRNSHLKRCAVCSSTMTNGISGGRTTMAISFKGAHFPPDIILMSVRWYLAYPLSYRHVEELMAERGVLLNAVDLSRRF